MRQASNVPAFLAGGIAGAGAGAAAGRSGSTSPPVTSAPSAYSQSQSQSHYAPSSSEQYPDYTAYNQYAQQAPQGYHPGGFAAEFTRQPSAGPSSGYSQTGTGSGTGSTGQPLLGGTFPSAKEREAYQRRTGMQLANPGEVVQHQDGGRAPQPGSPEEEEGEPPMEVPPRYDQIRD